MWKKLWLLLVLVAFLTVAGAPMAATAGTQHDDRGYGHSQSAKPPKVVKIEGPEEPVFSDFCGYDSDSYTIYADNDPRWHYIIDVTSSPEGYFESISVLLLPNVGYEFKKKTATMWHFEWTNDDPCNTTYKQKVSK